MPYEYTVRRAFTHEGTYYTNDNAGDIPALPRKVRDDRIERGYLEERHVGASDTDNASTEA